MLTINSSYFNRLKPLSGQLHPVMFWEPNRLSVGRSYPCGTCDANRGYAPIKARWWQSIRILFARNVVCAPLIESTQS